jgi:thioredoxin 1
MSKRIILLILITAVIIASGCIGGSQQDPTNSQEAQETTAVTEGMQNNSTVSKGILEKGAVVEVTQLAQINNSLNNGPVLVKIGAEWCDECQKMNPVLDELAAEYDGKATIVSVDTDKSPKLADYFGVNNIPDSFVIVGLDNGEYVYMGESGSESRDNRFKARILGLRDKELFEKILDFAIQEQKIKSN